MKRLCLSMVVLAISFVARADHRLSFVPALEITEVSDDNLNDSVDDPLRDRVRRITPTLGLRFDSPRCLARTSVSIDSEHYATHSALDDNRARERAEISLAYYTSPRVTLAINGGYLETNTAADLNADTALAASRIRGRRAGVLSSAQFRISSKTTASFSASSVKTEIVNGDGIRSQEQTFALERRVTPRDVFAVEYQHSHLTFEGQKAQTVNSQVVLAGWTRDLGIHDRFTLRVGPRFADRSLSADLSASLTHSWQRSSIALSLQRNQTTVIGYAGAVDSSSAQTKLSYAPNRRLTAYLAPAIFRSTHAELEGTVYRVAIGARYAITPLFDADIAYNRNRQNGAIDPARANANLSHAVLTVGFAARLNGADRTR